MATRYMIQVDVPGVGWSDTGFIFSTMTGAELFALSLMGCHTTRVNPVKGS